jgi:hypothetical protein
VNLEHPEWNSTNPIWYGFDCLFTTAHIRWNTLTKEGAGRTSNSAWIVAVARVRVCVKTFLSRPVARMQRGFGYRASLELDSAFDAGVPWMIRANVR